MAFEGLHVTASELDQHCRMLRRYCQPISLDNGELRVAAQSSAWATQLQLMAGTLLA